MGEPAFFWKHHTPKRAMSLGFNQLHPLKTTNLPGAVGANIVRRRSPGPSAKTVLAVRPSVARRPVAKAADPPPVSSAARPHVPDPDEKLARLYEETQVVYATAREALVDADGAEVATPGARVVLVYPMEESHTGEVRMRLKRAHPVSGQISLHWVQVHDGLRPSVRDFSLLP